MKPKAIQPPLPTGLVCPKCHCEVPAGKIVCDCFLVKMDAEMKDRALAELVSGQNFLYFTSSPTSGYHILPRSKDCLCFCRKKRYHKKRYHNPETLALTKDAFKEHKDLCRACAGIVATALLQSANAGEALATK